MSIIACTALLCCLAAQDPPSGQELLARVKAARRALTSGEVECQITTWRASGKPPAEQPSNLRHWWTRDSSRGDHIPGRGEFVGTREVDCLNCEAPGYGIWYADRPRLGVKIYRLNETNPPPAHSAGDVRFIGLTPNGLFTSMSFAGQWDGLFNPAKEPVKSKVTVSAVELDARKCWRVLFEYENGFQHAAWVDPARGPSVVRLENRVGNSVREVVCDVQRVDGTDHWFPRRARFAARKGDTETMWEVVEFTKVRVNVPIPPETFTVAGIRPLDGVGADIPGKGMMWYSGGKMIPAVVTATSNPVPPPPDTDPPVPVDPAAVRSVNPWLVAVCLASALTAVGLLLVRRRR